MVGVEPAGSDVEGGERSKPAAGETPAPDRRKESLGHCCTLNGHYPGSFATGSRLRLDDIIKLALRASIMVG